MTQKKPTGSVRERSLAFAVLFLASALLLALIVMMTRIFGGGTLEQMAPYGLLLVGVGVVAAIVILRVGRSLARKQRPEWLETQAWRQGLIDKLHQADRPEDRPPPPPIP